MSLIQNREDLIIVLLDRVEVELNAALLEPDVNRKHPPHSVLLFEHPLVDVAHSHHHDYDSPSGRSAF